MPRRSSQDLWTRGEALERAGDGRGAIDLFVKAALAEDEAGKPLRARLLWEQIAARTGLTGTVLERLAGACERGRLREEAYDYWVAAAARYAFEGRLQDAARARVHASGWKSKVAPHAPTPLAARAIAETGSSVEALLG
jgi:hypothetical protein